jgi:transposase
MNILHIKRVHSVRQRHVTVKKNKYKNESTLKLTINLLLLPLLFSLIRRYPLSQMLHNKKKKKNENKRFEII